MKGLSLFFLKNSMGANMKKTFRNSCNDEASTSTVPDHNATVPTNNPPRKSVTLEEMILQLELEEEAARRSHEQDKLIHRRMSCVNNSDILRSARNALNQYPRFSLDGKDAMYRSSFRKFRDQEQIMGRRRSNSVGGESVVWCNPGVVARLMGLDAMPVPVNRMMRRKKGNNVVEMNPNPNPNLRRKGYYNKRIHDNVFVGSSASSSSSRNGYCVMRAVDHAAGEGRASYSYSCQPTYPAYL